MLFCEVSYCLILYLCFFALVFILGCILRFLLWLWAFLKWICKNFSCPGVKIFSEEVPCVFFTYKWCFQGWIFLFSHTLQDPSVFRLHREAAPFSCCCVYLCSFYLFRWVRALLGKEEEMWRAVVRLGTETASRVLLLLVLLLSLYCVSSVCVSYYVFYVSVWYFTVSWRFPDN